MKKALSLILALSLCMALSIPALAARVDISTPSSIYIDDGISEGTAKYDGKDVPVYGMKPGATLFKYDVWPDILITVYYADIDNGAATVGDISSQRDAEFFTEWGFGEDTYWGYYFDPEDVGIYRYFKIEDGYGTTTFFVHCVSDNSAAPETPAATTPATPATPAGSGAYTAQKYDTYGKLAVNYYGSYAYTKALQKANNYKALKAGTAVTLPDKLGSAVRLAPATAGAGETLYTVVAGDTLGAIAKAYYGNSAQYKAIFERNADRLKNANTIYEGQIIVLPAK